MSKITKKGLCSLKLENVEKVLNSDNNDFTIRFATFSVLDFNESGNAQIVDKDECELAKNTLLNKPLLCQYLPSNNDDNDNPNDDFGNHGEVEIKLRNGGEYISTNTHAVGTCVNVFFDTVKDDNGNDVECFLAKFELWFDRYPNEIMLMNDFFESGDELYSSCEYYYSSFFMDENGIEHPKKITFSGHTLLGSRDNKIEPAYQTSKLISFNSKWNKALNSLKSNKELGFNIEKNQSKNDVQKEENETMENIFLNAIKSKNEISLGDLRSKILGQLGDLMTANEYEYMWLSNYSIYPDGKYFVYETYDNESEKWVNYKVTYTVDVDDNLTVNYDTKEKVEYQLVTVEDLTKSVNALNEANDKIKTLEGEVKSLNEQATEKSNNSKADEFKELTDKLVALNSLVETMKPIVDKYNEGEYQKALNSAMNTYKEKFTSVNALDVFESDETQALIKKSVNADKKEADKATIELNTLVVNSIKPVQNEINTDDIMTDTTRISINQVKKSENENKNLLDSKDAILAEYGLNY